MLSLGKSFARPRPPRLSLPSLNEWLERDAGVRTADLGSEDVLLVLSSVARLGVVPCQGRRAQQDTGHPDRCQPQELVVLGARGQRVMRRKPRGLHRSCPVGDSLARRLTPPRAHRLGASAAPHGPSLRSVPGPSAGSSSTRFSRRPTCPDASVAGSLPTPPVPRHRKSHSLGNKWVTVRAPLGLYVGWA